jgi:hypothetical protein
MASSQFFIGRISNFSLLLHLCPRTGVALGAVLALLLVALAGALLPVAFALASSLALFHPLATLLALAPAVPLAGGERRGKRSAKHHRYNQRFHGITSVRLLCRLRAIRKLFGFALISVTSARVMRRRCTFTAQTLRTVFSGLLRWTRRPGTG